MSNHIISIPNLSDGGFIDFTHLYACDNSAPSRKQLLAIVKWDGKKTIGFFRVTVRGDTDFETKNLNSAVDRYNELP